jgi:hypothetical protein
MKQRRKRLARRKKEMIIAETKNRMMDPVKWFSRGKCNPCMPSVMRMAYCEHCLFQPMDLKIMGAAFALKEQGWAKTVA